jgi:stearoyl-CoA desaturase (delta-9 desaturase)
MHRMHHAYSDTEKDPHSPHFFKDIYEMLKNTVIIYRSFLLNKNIPEEEFTKDYLPVWDKLDRFGHHIITRISFMVLYILIYVFFAPSFWWFFLLPIHFLMGPIQGAIVNWCGHKYGYSNFNNADHSKNTGPFGFVLLGELFQNNHHHAKGDANFAKKWFEVDLTYQIMRVFNFAGIIRLNKVNQSLL